MSEVTEQVLLDIATSKTSKVGQKLAAINKLVQIEKAKARDELSKQRLELQKALAAAKRREADAAVIALNVDKIKAKALLLAEQRKKRAADKAESRALNKTIRAMRES